MVFSIQVIAPCSMLRSCGQLTLLLKVCETGGAEKAVSVLSRRGLEVCSRFVVRESQKF